MTTQRSQSVNESGLSRFQPPTLGEFLALPEPEHRYLIEGLLPSEGLVVVLAS